MRRSVPAEPFAASATWTRRLALCGAALAVVAVVLAQRSAVDVEVTLTILAGGLLLAALAWLTGLSAAGVLWRTGRRGAARTIAGLALASATLSYPAYLAAEVLRTSMPADLSTDPADPPRFSSSTKARSSRGAFGNGPASIGSAALPAPGVGPATLDATAPEALGAVVRAVGTLRWHVVDTAPARPGPAQVDATAYSVVMHLPVEMAIRIKPVGGQSRIDMRATSRLGLPDFGDNLRNIRSLSEALEEQDDDK